jgi:alpha-beta hydrolase superfamily lysophospholipase
MEEVREGRVRSPTGVDLCYRWCPTESARGTLVFVHGLAEHLERLETVFEFFGSRGFSCFGFDLRGHGRSGGARHHVPRFERYLDDLDLLLARLDELDSPAPRFLVGHSAGGLIALTHALERAPRLAGLILVSPALAFALAPSLPLLLAARLLDVLIPTFPIPSQVPLDRVSRNEEVERILRAENPRGIRITPRWYFACRAAQAKLAAGIGELSLPLLTLAAGDDALVDSEAAGRLHRASGAAPEDFVLLDGCRHALFDEPNREEILARIATWITTRIATGIEARSG